MTRSKPMPRDHGGGIDAAVLRYGGMRHDWLDLSTGINPNPYPVADLPDSVWKQLPDEDALDRLITAARSFWHVPDAATLIAGPGTSALIAQIPSLTSGKAFIPGPTYNEHEAAFRAHGRILSDQSDAPVHVYVHPNNPDGRLWSGARGAELTVLDESFCDTAPELSQTQAAADQDVIILKSFGKFWGLAGLRLGFAIGRPVTLAPDGRASLTDKLGPWAISGPALEIGARALSDLDWAIATRRKLREAAEGLDQLMVEAGADLLGGTSLFRTYEVEDAERLHTRLAKAFIWTRIFPYSTRWIRLGLPGMPQDWQRLKEALR